MVAGAAALLTFTAVAACGDDDDEGAGSTTTAEVSETTAADDGGETTETTEATDGGDTSGFVEGCGPQSVTDPTIIDPEREVARCEPGYPAPQPLAERQKIVIASAFRLEFNSPLLLAISQGEFEKENIEVEFVNVPYADAVPQMASGDIDMAVGGFELALFNAGNLGLPVRATLGNYFPPDAGNYDEPQTGLWCRRSAFSNPEDPDFLETADLKWSSSVGKGSVSVYYSIAEIERRTGGELDTTDTVIEAIPNADALTALRNGGVDCAILLDPFWLEIAEDPEYVLAASQTPGEPLGQYSFGKRLLEDRELGVAVARAFIRSVNTWFQGDYHADDEVMNLISTEISRPVDDLRLVPSLVMDWEIREGTTTRIQELFIDSGTITDFTEPVPEDAIIDRSFYLEAVGAE
jgi:NitT/TauT family transport system substrate-binding protein